jgi:hypothetical protein
MDFPGLRLHPLKREMTGFYAVDVSGVGIDGLGLQPLELQVFEMGLVIGVEIGFG